MPTRSSAPLRTGIRSSCRRFGNSPCCLHLKGKTHGPYCKFYLLNPRVCLVHSVCSIICTGAIFAANLGVFNDTFCTTHWGVYSTVAKYLEEGAKWAQSKPGTLLESRYVDPGINSHGVRIISTGGSMCGVDASLHVVRSRYGMDEASLISKLMDYGWNPNHGAVFGLTS
jgi:hypothetical protein